MFQIMLSDASRTLSTALNGKAYYKQVTVVVPTSWRNTKCNQEIHLPRSGSSYGVSQIILDKDIYFNKISNFGRICITPPTNIKTNISGSGRVYQ